jgi:hypothetical protein
MDADYERDDGHDREQHQERWVLIAPRGLASAPAGTRYDCTLSGHLADRGWDGIKVCRPENARTFRNSAAHTRRGLRRKPSALAPTTAARFAVGASVLIERCAPGTQLERPLV